MRPKFVARMIWWGRSAGTTTWYDSGNAPFASAIRGATLIRTSAATSNGRGIVS
jgi:hypothetical protein